MAAGFGCSESREFDGKSRGFRMTFENGITVSVQWHHGSYIDDRGNDGESANAEIAIFASEELQEKLKRDGSWLTRDILKFFGEDPCDDVKGYCTPKDVADILAFCASFRDTTVQQTFLMVSAPALEAKTNCVDGEWNGIDDSAR